MENFVNQYNIDSVPNEIDYSKVEGVYPATYGNTDSYNAYPVETYSDNIEITPTSTDYLSNIDITTSIPVEPSQDYSTTSYQVPDSTPYEISSNTYDISNNINTGYTENLNSNEEDILLRSSLVENEVISTPITPITDTNIIDTTYQPTYQESSYIDTTNVEYNTITNPVESTTDGNFSGFTESTSNIVNYDISSTPVDYNIPSDPINYNTVDYSITSSPVDYNITSSNVDYNITSTPVDYNIASNTIDYNYINNNTYNTQVETEYNDNFISDLRNSYFNLNDNAIRYSTSSYNPNNNYSSSYTTDDLPYNMSTTNFKEVSRYSTSSVPLNIPEGAETMTEYIPVEEIEYIPIKKKKLIKRTKVKVPVKKKVVIPKKVVVRVPVKKKVYVPQKKKIIVPKTQIHVLPPRTSSISTIQMQRSLSPVRSTVNYVPLSPVRNVNNTSINNNLRGSGVYSPRVYRIYLNKNKK